MCSQSRPISPSRPPILLLVRSRTKTAILVKLASPRIELLQATGAWSTTAAFSHRGSKTTSMQMLNGYLPR